MNVIPVVSVLDAVRYANVATQTVGVYPPNRKSELRDKLAGAGVQRLVRLGSVLKGSSAGVHDGMFPLHRMVNWVVDDDA